MLEDPLAKPAASKRGNQLSASCAVFAKMWLGWEHCGYDAIDDEPRDPESSIAWQPPPSGRGERGMYGDAGLGG